MTSVTGYLLAFAVGGALCVVAQLLIDLTRLTPAKILVGYVVSGVILSAVGIYGWIARIADCGASVPLTGFGHALAEGVKKAVDADGPIGILTGGLTATAAGITVALTAGYASALLFKAKPKQ